MRTRQRWATRVGDELLVGHRPRWGPEAWSTSRSSNSLWGGVGRFGVRPRSAMSSVSGRGEWSKLLEDLAGDVALEDAHDLGHGSLASMAGSSAAKKPWAPAIASAVAHRTRRSSTSAASSPHTAPSSKAYRRLRTGAAGEFDQRGRVPARLLGSTSPAVAGSSRASERTSMRRATSRATRPPYECPNDMRAAHAEFVQALDARAGVTGDGDAYLPVPRFTLPSPVNVRAAPGGRLWVGVTCPRGRRPMTVAGLAVRRSSAVGWTGRLVMA